MSKLPSSLRSSFFNAFSNKSTTQQKKHHSLEKKHHSLEFAESAQAISKYLVGYIQKEAQIINTTQLQVDSVIYPVVITGHIYQDARAWIKAGTQGTRGTPKLLDLLSKDRDLVSIYASSLMNDSQLTAQKNFMKQHNSQSTLIQTEGYKSGNIWITRSQSHASKIVITSLRGNCKAVTPDPQTYQGNFTALCITDQQEKTKEKVLIAMDMLKLLKDLCEKKLPNGKNISKDDINQFEEQMILLRCKINQNVKDDDKGRLLEINIKLGALITSIKTENSIKAEKDSKKDTSEESTVVYKAESKEESKEEIPADDAAIREQLNQRFLGPILKLMPEINTKKLREQTLSILQESNLLDLGTQEFKLSVLSELGNNALVYSEFSSDLSTFILESKHETEAAIPDLEGLKFARDQFSQKIMQLMIEDINLISSNNSKYIETLFKAVNEYDTLINEIDSENNSENSAAGKTNHDDCGAGGSSGAGAGAGAKGKGPDFTEQQEKILKLAQDSGFEPTDPEEFADSAEHPVKMLWGAMVFLTKNNMNTPAGVIFGMLLKNEELTLENKMLTEENQRLTEQGLAVPDAIAVDPNTGAVLPLTQSTSQVEKENSEPSAPSLLPLPRHAVAFQAKAGKSGKKAPEEKDANGPS